ncbi:methyltransferase type 12 [Burkholderia multivorans]|nr:methyltransferase type 12 [Burkholderia multivorans]PRE88458.1 methyltransferase type 12 [Burkholderia multivorans]PRG20775.1 methyltransferase type 12 [Burkholderia multivorans]
MIDAMLRAACRVLAPRRRFLFEKRNARLQPRRARTPQQSAPCADDIARRVAAAT